MLSDELKWRRKGIMLGWWKRLTALKCTLCKGPIDTLLSGGFKVCVFCQPTRLRLSLAWEIEAKLPRDPLGDFEPRERGEWRDALEDESWVELNYCEPRDCWLGISRSKQRDRSEQIIRQNPAVTSCRRFWIVVYVSGIPRDDILETRCARVYACGTGISPWEIAYAFETEAAARRAISQVQARHGG